MQKGAQKNCMAHPVLYDYSGTYQILIFPTANPNDELIDSCFSNKWVDNDLNESIAGLESSDCSSTISLQPET